MHKIIFFSRKKKYVCQPYLKFSDPLPKTQILFYLAKEPCNKKTWPRGYNTFFILNATEHEIFYCPLKVKWRKNFFLALNSQMYKC